MGCIVKIIRPLSVDQDSMLDEFAYLPYVQPLYDAIFPRLSAHDIDQVGWRFGYLPPIYSVLPPWFRRSFFSLLHCLLQIPLLVLVRPSEEVLGIDLIGCWCVGSSKIIWDN